MKRVILQLIMPLLAATVMIGCSGSRDSRGVTIAVSIPPQATLLQQIAGDSVSVVTLMGAQSNPESFEVTVANMRAISDADMYMTIGNLPVETVVTGRIADASGSLRFVDVGRGVDLIYGTHCHEGHGHDHSQSDEAADPHIWTSAVNLKIIAGNMLKALVSLDPENAARYTSNHAALVARLDSLDNAIRRNLRASGVRAFLIWHPSLSYFARDYGLQQISLGQDNKELTPRQIVEFRNEALHNSASTMFMQQNFDARQAESLSRDLGLDVVSINPLDPDYEAQFNIITDAITRQ